MFIACILTQENGSDAAEDVAEDAAPDADGPAPVREESDSDFATESEQESASDHEEEDLRWKKSKEWDHKVRAKPLLHKLDNLVWKTPVKRGSTFRL